MTDIVYASQSNSRQGWSTNIILDLNVIISMEKVIFCGVSLESASLRGFVDVLHDLEFYVSPGFAFSEVKAERAVELRGAFEGFCSKYFRKMIDAPDARYSNRDSSNSRIFALSLPSKQIVFSQFYASMLLINLISKQKEPPLEKFQTYMQKLAETTDIVGAIDCLVAQFCFFDRSALKNFEFNNFCKTIKENFCKGGGTPDKMFENSYNQAHDLYLLHGAAHGQGKIFSGKKSDFWVAVADEGLTYLASLFRYAPGFDGSWTGEYEFNIPFDEMETDPFWVKSYSAFHDYIGKRQKQREERGDSIDLKVIHEATLLLEEEIRQKWM